MPIKSISLYKIPYIRNLSGISKTREIQKLEIPNFIVNINHISGDLGEILEKIVGAYTKNDLNKINMFIEKYSKYNICDLKKIHDDLRTNFYPNILSRIIKKQEESNIYSYLQTDMTKSLQNQIKEYTLKMYALKIAINKNTPLLVATPYNCWLKTDFKLQNRKISGRISEHPCDKVVKNTGELNNEDLEKVELLKQKFKALNIFDIWKEKIKILNKIEKTLSNGNPDLMFSYTDKEFDKMKEFLIKYRALNKCQISLGYYTKHLESLMYSQIPKYNLGEYINGLGIIQEKLNINNKPAILTFGDIYRRHSLKLYDLNRLKEYENFIRDLPERIIPEKLNDLNKEAEIVLYNQDKSLISEIFFEVTEKEKIKNILKQQNANDIIEDCKYYYFITSFQNHKKIEYPTGAKMLGIYLLKFLKDRNAAPIFLQAEPYESKHSPVSLYLRAGFEPINHTREEVLNNINSNKSEYRGEPLFMYAKNFDKIGDLVDKMYSLYFNK